MKSRKNLFFGLTFLVIGITIGLLVAARLDILPKLKASTESAYTSAFEIEEAMVKVSKDVGQSVVSISTVHISEQRPRRYQFGTPFQGTPFEDDLFKRFFEDFFGEMPHKQMGLGSGVIIDESGYILTNEHVIEGADKITVTLPDGREFKGELKGTDPRSDLAIIEISARNLPAVKLGDSDEVNIGQWVLAIGNPFAIMMPNPEPTVTSGVISALHRSLPRTSMRDRDYTDLIQTDAAINPGNSGGPLVNLKGEVVGINVAIFSTTGGYQGVGFAIPSNVAKRVMSSLIEGKKVLYGWLGVSVQEVTEDLAEYFKLDKKEGVIVGSVFEDSPAEKSGIKSGDIIISFAGKSVTDVRTLLKLVGTTEVGKKVKVAVLRDGKMKTLDIEIGARPEDLSKISSSAAEEEKGWRGLSVSSITPEIANRFRLDNDKGVIVIEVEPNTPADEAGFAPGDIITEIDRKEIKNIQDFNKAIKSVKGDALVRTEKGYTVIKAE
ncbi:MAG: Do family serine endopeptidase [Candidatus Omnitrophota bacterium]